MDNECKTNVGEVTELFSKNKRQFSIITRSVAKSFEIVAIGFAVALVFCGIACGATIGLYVVKNYIYESDSTTSSNI